jgi:hypothetical protein
MMMLLFAEKESEREKSHEKKENTFKKELHKEFLKVFFISFAKIQILFIISSILLPTFLQ